ncbi:NAD(+) diphosphatase [Parablautia muri]|uniref:NAD(+) diphosphatase n=1 Tax=Parablautia muri TaxID=2320879 RepID=A0A9X5GQI4_9FIRM|nr:NAD(+) diphosphatase [Parablautia muri]NBJ91106.1 NAD(+) diphosphatase [Parablautia muri]
MIQDIYPKIYHNEYHDIKPTENDFILIFHKNMVLLRFKDVKLRYPTLKEIAGLPYTYYYLFSIDNYKYFLAFPNTGPGQNKQDIPLSLEHYHYEDVRIFRTANSRHSAFAGITAHHLFIWYQANQFCGRCGHKMVPDQKERMLFCPDCHNIVYPKISPAVIVGVLNGNKLLMSKYAGRSYANYALIAGFTEIGESVEQTVEREVMEEVGLKVKNIRYYKSQPWAFSDSLLMGFFCELDGSDQITLDTNELAEAGWYSPNEITLEDDHVSLTREMIMLFKNGGLS